MLNTIEVNASFYLASKQEIVKVRSIENWLRSEKKTFYWKMQNHILHFNHETSKWKVNKKQIELRHVMWYDGKYWPWSKKSTFFSFFIQIKARQGSRIYRVSQSINVIEKILSKILNLNIFKGYIGSKDLKRLKIKNRISTPCSQIGF